MINKIIVLIILYIFTIYNKMIIKQYKLFDFHNHKYFDFEKSLTQIELNYVYFILNHSPIELFNKTMGKKRLSYITYSHIINKTEILSGRLSIGSIMMPDYSLMYALDIIKERRIILPKYLFSEDYKFGGLGWDFIKNRFKIYFRCINDKFINLKDVNSIIEYNKKNCGDDDINIYDIIDDFNTDKYWNEGILSFTYYDNHEIEKKIYLYPKDEPDTTYMISNIRPITIQHDDEISTTNDNVTKLLNEYGKEKIYLDTYSKENDNYVLYFPR